VSVYEFDTGKRQLLNFGHTIGHAIEKATSFEISHGIAVGIGMAIISKISDCKGWSTEKTHSKITECLENNGIPTNTDVKTEELLSAMVKDKKRSGDMINLVIPEKIGNCVLKSVAVSELEEVLKCR
jgi:3-dehydroquinate synthase